jgi:hypothetical protein
MMQPALLQPAPPVQFRYSIRSPDENQIELPQSGILDCSRQNLKILVFASVTDIQNVRSLKPEL